MKTPLNILEEVSAEFTESTSLLEMIIRNAPDMGETDNALACLVRSMKKTTEKTQTYIESHYCRDNNTADVTEVNMDVADAIDGAMLNINKALIVGSRYYDAVFADKDESENEYCLIIRTLIDFAGAAHSKLKTARTELIK
ncbi:hypothetical protein AXA88_19320 [Salmonella enterica]|nr:hypothetical protein [Salmonella enterica]EAX3608024.1 hypothetical protein [Salmonella enterica]EGW6281704.1 hypothetical protein [Salmonella enterica]EGX3934234.1 hypothetical protein [Salmonella enterica]